MLDVHPKSPAPGIHALDTRKSTERPSVGPIPADILEAIVESMATALVLDVQAEQADPAVTVESPCGRDRAHEPRAA
jgi:hypothetical protein